MAWSRTRQSSRSRNGRSDIDRWVADEAAGGTITRIEPQPHRGRVNVYLDDRFAFSLSAEITLPREGDELDITAIRRALAHDQVSRAYEQALQFLGPRPRSIAEVRRRLARHGHDPETVEAVLQRLERHQFIDDDAFAAYWVGQRQAFHPRGPRALRAELRVKGVQAGTIEDAIGPVSSDQESAAYRCAQKRAKALSATAERPFTHALSAYLLRRGFDYGAVRTCVERLWTETRSAS